MTKHLLVLRVAYLAHAKRQTAAKKLVVWGHSNGYLDEIETAALIRKHRLGSA